MNKRYVYILIMVLGINSCSPTQLVDQTMNSFVVTATQGEFEQKIVLTWTDLEVYKNYVVLRSDSQKDTYEEISPLIKSGTFDDLTVEKGKTYYYKIRAYNSLDMPVFITKYTYGYAGAGAGFYPPDNIMINSGQSTVKLAITWDRVKDAVEYEIWKSEDNEYFQPLAKIPYLHYNDTEVKQGVTYYYQISSIDKDGLPSPNRSQTKSGILFGGNTKLSSKVGAYKDKIEISWNKIPFATMYTIYRSDKKYNIGTSIAVITNDRSTYQYIDHDVNQSKIYYYTIIYGNDSAIQQSYTIRSYTKVDNAPAKPNNFQVSQGTDAQFITISWDAVNAVNRESMTYEVLRAISRTGPWTMVYTGKDTKYRDAPPNDSYTYFYKVVALNPLPGEESDILEGWANKPPTHITASDNYGKKVILKWDKVPHAQSYNVYYSLNKHGTFTFAGAVHNNVGFRITFEHIYDIGELQTQELFYKIDVKTAHSQSVQSTIVKGIIKKIEAPKNLQILKNKTATQTLTLRWDNVLNARKYTIYRATLKHRGVHDDVQLSDNAFKKIAEVQNNAYQANLSVFPLRRYIYKVKAVDGGGAEGLAATSGIAWRVPVSVDEFLKDVDFTIIHAQKQVNNFGYNGSSGTIHGRYQGRYEYKAGVSGSKSSWFDYSSFEVILNGTPSLSISVSPMGAYMNGDVTITGLYTGKITYNNLLGLNGGYTGKGSITATYNHPKYGQQTKTWTYTEAGAILQSVILQSESKPPNPTFEEGSSE